MKDSELGIRQRLNRMHQIAERDAGPPTDRTSAFDAIVAMNLRPRGQFFQRRERPTRRSLNQAADFHCPFRGIFRNVLGIVFRTRIGITVRRKHPRDVDVPIMATPCMADDGFGP